MKDIKGIGPLKKCVLVSLCFLFFSSCSSTSSIDEERELRYYRRIYKGYLDTEGCKLKGVNDSFVIEQGPFKAPFHSTMYKILRTPAYSDRTEDGKAYSTSLRDSYETALEGGARRVWVHHPSRKKPFYGVLMLNKVYKLVDETGSDSYRIIISPEHIHQALKGKIALSYEYVNYKRRKRYTWALWISKNPLW